MIITFSGGKIIASLHEIVVRLPGEHCVTLSAQVDAIQLLAGSNVIVAHGAECKWSLKLDNDTQLAELADHLGIAITQ